MPSPRRRRIVSCLAIAAVTVAACAPAPPPPPPPSAPISESQVTSKPCVVPAQAQSGPPLAFSLIEDTLLGDERQRAKHIFRPPR